MKFRHVYNYENNQEEEYEIEEMLEPLTKTNNENFILF